MITIHDRLMMYKGNFRSSRKIRKRPEDVSKTGKKKGNENKLILVNPEIGNSIEIITGTAGCGVGVKALRNCFKSLLEDHTDSRFTGRLMKIVTEIYHRDLDGVTGKKSIFFTRQRDFLSTLIFNPCARNIDRVLNQCECSHTGTRYQATLTMSGLSIKPVDIPRSATHYGFLNHLSIISDYTYSEINQRFEPLSLLNTLNAVTYSKYIPVGDPITEKIEVSLSVNDDLPDTVSVIQCVGIEYSYKSLRYNFIPTRGGSVMVYEVF